MKMHRLLLRQLNRCGLIGTELPDSVDKWRAFIDCINKVYFDSDEERYLLDRSMEISSKEIMDLNKKLEDAQRIAEIGYWNYDSISNKMIWSKELFKLFGISTSQKSPTYDEYLQMVHPSDKKKIDNLIKRAIKKGIDYECEIRIKTVTGENRWHYARGGGYNCKTLPCQQLSGILMDITKRKIAEKEIERLNQQILDSARSVGMADVATSILHNIGNVLNSVNISLGLLNENINDAQYKKFFKIGEILKKNLPNLSQYLLEDKQGKLIPNYLTTLSEAMKERHDLINQEMSNLGSQIQHIKEIVAGQQSLSYSKKLEGKVNLQNLINTAISISTIHSNTHHIKVKKNYEKIPSILIDKAKLLQIIVNLMLNAKESVLNDNDNDEKEIIIHLKKLNSNKKNRIQLSISDNGLGIDPKNLSKIFTFGFTTKNYGHGFGLHGSAIAAKEIGSELKAYSEGKSKGATFTLTIPLEEGEVVENES